MHPQLPTHRPARRFRRASAALLRRFARDEDGALLIFGVYVFLIILMVGGIGIDLMRFERDRSELQYTLDRAVLAAADLDQPLPPKEVVRDYFSKSGLSQYLNEPVVTQGLNFRNVSATAQATMPTQFMHMTGIDTLTVPAAGAAEERVPKVEISLVLDISGSMRFDGRMTALRPAAKKFVSMVLKGDAKKNTSINLIPYAGQTNPGPWMFDRLHGVRFGTTGADNFPEWSEGIDSVTLWFDRDGDGDIDYSAKIEGYPASDVDGFDKDDLDDYFEYAVDHIRRTDSEVLASTDVVGATIQGGTRATEFFSADGSGGSGPTDIDEVDAVIQFDAFYASVIRNDLASCLELGSGDFTDASLPDGASYDQVAHFMNWEIASDVMDWGWCPQDRSSIVYASNSEAALNNMIQNMRMHDGTGTHYAMKYAVALLNPDANATFQAMEDASLIPEEFADRPAPWSDTETVKYIILMTDGQITEQVRPKETLHPKNPVQELNEGRKDDRTQITSASTNVNRFYAQCNLAKDPSRNIIVYTIAFEAPSSAKTQMKNCASSPAHFFVAGTKDIEQVFSNIARQINELKLVN